jgi:hypothetical protein
VHEAVEDGVGDCRIDDHFVPVIDGELTGHDRRAAAVAIVDDFEQVAALLRGQRCQPPIVEDQKVDTGEALEEAYICAPRGRCQAIQASDISGSSPKSSSIIRTSSDEQYDAPASRLAKRSLRHLRKSLKFVLCSNWEMAAAT